MKFLALGTMMATVGMLLLLLVSPGTLAVRPRMPDGTATTSYEPTTDTTETTTGDAGSSCLGQCSSSVRAVAMLVMPAQCRSRCLLSMDEYRLQRFVGQLSDRTLYRLFQGGISGGGRRRDAISQGEDVDIDIDRSYASPLNTVTSSSSHRRHYDDDYRSIPSSHSLSQSLQQSRQLSPESKRQATVAALILHAGMAFPRIQRVFLRPYDRAETVASAVDGDIDGSAVAQQQEPPLELEEDRQQIQLLGHLLRLSFTADRYLHLHLLAYAKRMYLPTSSSSSNVASPSLSSSNNGVATLMRVALVARLSHASGLMRDVRLQDWFDHGLMRLRSGELRRYLDEARFFDRQHLLQLARDSIRSQLLRQRIDRDRHQHQVDGYQHQENQEPVDDNGRGDDDAAAADRSPASAPAPRRRRHYGGGQNDGSVTYQMQNDNNQDYNDEADDRHLLMRSKLL